MRKFKKKNNSKNFFLLLLISSVTIITPFFAYATLDFSKLQATFIKKYGSSSLSLFNSWQNMISTSMSLKVDDQTKRVNESLNRVINWQEDQKTWGMSDYWATPLETIAKKAGDCEDFAIIKYFSLLDLGVPVNQLRLVYVKAKNGNGTSSTELAHMVLAYYPSLDQEPFILDNMLSDIKPASRRPDLTPVFSFNSEGIYNGAMSNGGQSDSVERLSKWQDLLQRSKNEGFN